MTTISRQTFKEDDDRIARIIDQVLRQIFGNKAARLIYRYLETRYAVKPYEVVEKIDLFAKGLEEFLRTGAYVVERKILEDVYSSYGFLQKLELEETLKGDFVGQIKMIMERV